jgi:hypothetical protein
MDRPSEITISQDRSGLKVALPWRWWILRSLRVTFPNSRAADELWTYVVPGKLAPRRIEHWLSEVHLRIAADNRRRTWSASDAEWNGAEAAARTPDRIEAPGEPVVVRVPPVGTTRATLALIAALEAGEVLIVSVMSGAGKIYTLQPSNKAVLAHVAERAIREQFIRPACDGLLGPETSQTWRAA